MVTTTPFTLWYKPTLVTYTGYGMCFSAIMFAVVYITHFKSTSGM